MKIAEIFESKRDLKTLYCSRKLLNGEELVKWAEDQGFKKCLDPSDMHVTVAYSKKKIDWSHLTDSFDTVNSKVSKKYPEETKREVKQFDGGAIVLTFVCGDLEHRWQEFNDDFGASWDHEGYHPHVTITYDGLPKGMNLEDIKPFDGELRFGPEILQPVNTEWKAKVKETTLEEGYSQSKLQNLAAIHENNIYDENDPLGGSASEWNWKYNPAVPLSYFIKEMSAEEWKNSVDFHDYHDELFADSNIKEPVIIVERNGALGIWDGWHRIASSFITGRATLPAIIGTRKVVEEATQSIDLTETKPFKEWFRDSKVVGADGKPLVVYHGTSKKFRAFNIKKSVQPIIWFTSDRSEIENGQVGAAGSGHILELYASIQNPADWKAYDQLGLGEFKGRGFDGAILPSGNGFNGFVFEPAQLKSATKNNGNFDRFNRNLNEADLYYVQPDGSWKKGDGRGKGLTKAEVEKLAKPDR